MANLPEQDPKPKTHLNQDDISARPRDPSGHFLPRGGKTATTQVVEGQRYFSKEELYKRSRLMMTSRTPILHDLGVLANTLQPSATTQDPRVNEQLKAFPDLHVTGRNFMIRRPDDFSLGKLLPLSISFDPENFKAGRIEGKAHRQELFLDQIKAGKGKYAAAREIGISPNTYRKWTHNEPDFATDLQDALDTAAQSRSFGLDPALDKFIPDFEDFRLYYFGMESPEHHLQIIDAIESASADEWTLILMPPDAGKTTLIKDWILYKWACDPDHGVMYVGEKDDSNSTPTKVMMDIKERCTKPDYRDPNATYDTRYDEFISVFGPFRMSSEDKDRPWTRSAIKIHKAGGGSKFSLETASYLSRVLGSRVDAIIFDDVQSEQTLGQSDTILDRIRGVFASRYSREKGKVIFLGNGVGAGSVYEELIKADMIHTVIKIPAITEQGESYWPRRWPIKDLVSRRKLVGEQRWLANYMQQPRSPGTQVFANEVIDLAKDRDQIVSTSASQWAKARSTSGLEIVAGIDPAISGECAIHVAAFTNDQMTIIDHDTMPNPGTNEAIFERIRYMTRHRFTRLVFEYNAQQKGIGRDVRLEKLATTAGFVIEPHETGANKRDVNYGVAAMASSFIRREILMPWGDEASRARMKPVCDQLASWRPDVPTKLLKQDAVMAMWFTWLWWEKHRELLVDEEESWDFDVPSSFTDDEKTMSAFSY